jgi:hypothetical protein
LPSSERWGVRPSSLHGCGKRTEKQETMRAMSVMRFVFFVAVASGGKRSKV